MTDQNIRRLPKNVLRLDEAPNMEAMDVQRKYSNPAAQIGEKNVDFVALNYLNDEAVAFWLPKLLDYVENSAPPDSYHLEEILFKLADENFCRRLKTKLKSRELNAVSAYLRWLKLKSNFLSGSRLRAKDCEKAIVLWDR